MSKADRIKEIEKKWYLETENSQLMFALAEALTEDKTLEKSEDMVKV
jgi:hypothetical protein